MQKIINKDVLFWTRLAVFLAFMIPFFICYDLWFSERLFPLVPVFDNLLVPNYTFDVILITLFVLLFFVFVFYPKWTIGIPIIIIYTYWVLLDQNRIQNFFFEIILMVFAMTEFRYNNILNKRCILIILIGTYFWSGLHKFNPIFLERWSLGLSRRISFVPSFFRDVFTYAVPFLEASFGVCLIFSNTRKIGIWLLALMHTIILVTLTMSNYGFVVFPLNIFNVFVLFFLFYRKPFNESVFKLNFTKSYIVFFVAILFPVLNFFGYYDHILSFSYFSGKPKYCRIYFSSSEEAKQLPSNIRENIREHNSVYYIDFNEWAGKTLGILVYPEERVYIKLQKHINSFIDTPNTRLEFYGVAGGN
ncbi:MauE/DoxX family redox-associated membrane protein [Seonamhaeicola sp. ML3]|uniref:MauE/DoxX family redox-associated membrane protein n=1 Tax=Seonamhaeicola sp. ML3 TaxID=2937786 RepID=UPI00200FCC94|nr:MauE/DoxX family redox-associated membrane protein [Seonamhaeicola sp. ML3]